MKVALNPTGATASTGHTVTKKVKAAWSKGQYRATVKFKTKATGKLTVSSSGAKTVSKVAAKPKGVFVGWSTKTQTHTASIFNEPERDIELRGAWGRTYYVQAYRSSKWVSVKTVKAYNGPSDFSTVTVPSTWSMSPTSKWRLYAPATTQAASVTSGVWTLVVANQRNLGQTAKLSTESWTLSSVKKISSYTDRWGETVVPKAGEQLVLLSGTFTQGGLDAASESCDAGYARVYVHDKAGRSLVQEELEIDAKGDPDCENPIFPGQSRPFTAVYRGLASASVARVDFEDSQTADYKVDVFFLP